MTTDGTPTYIQLNVTARLQSVLGISVLLIGLTCWAGWLLDIEWLRRPLGGPVAMNPLSALCFVLCAGALLAHRAPARPARWAGVAAWATIGIGAAKVLLVLLGAPEAMETLLFHDRLTLPIYGGRPNVMAPNTALCFMLAGAALVLARRPRGNGPGAARWAEVLALVMFMLATVAILGHIYEVPELYGIGGHMPMALHTAIGFFLLSASSALLARGPLVRHMDADGPGSAMLRLLVPMAVAAPMVFGFMRVSGQQLGLFSPELGTLMAVLAEMVLLVALLFRVAAEADHGDRQQKENEALLTGANARLEEAVQWRTAALTEARTALEAKVRELEEYRFAVDQGAIVAVTDVKGIITKVNANFCRISGYTEQELIGQDHRIVNSGHHPKEFIRELWRTIAAGQVWRGELKNRAKDGSHYWVDTTIVPFLRPDGRPDHYLAIRSDITERKLAEEQLSESEERFRRTLDNMMEGVQIIGPDMRYRYVNGAVTRHGGRTAQELMGRTMAECYPGIEHTEVYRCMVECMHTRRNIHMENEFTYPDGSKACFELSIQSVPEGIFILSIDITERKAAELEVTRLTEGLERTVKERTAQLTEALAKVTDLYDHAPCGYHSIDAHGRFIQVNATEQEWLGYTEAEMRAMNGIGDVLTPESREVFAANFPVFKATGRLVDLEMEMVRKDGTLLPVLINATAVLDADGNYLHSRSTVLDKTRLKAAREQIQTLNKELEAFSYSVSHDLRAPLRAMNGFAEMMQQQYGSVLDDNGLRLLGIIRSNAVNMGRLIDDLLQLSRTGRKEVEWTQTDMAAIVAHAVRECTTDLTGPQPTVTVEPLPQVRCDARMMEQVWKNLIGNAVKYSAKTASPTVRIWAETGPAMVTYHVADNGTGFDMTYAHKLFGVFQRLHSSKEFEGTGVGLAIVHRIVTKHGGTVSAMGELGKGATFSFTVPLGAHHIPSA